MRGIHLHYQVLTLTRIASDPTSPNVRGVTPWLTNECRLDSIDFAGFFRKTGKATFTNSA